MSHPEDRETRRPPDDVSQTLQISVAEAQQAYSPMADRVWQISVEVVGGPMDGLRNRIEGPSFTIGRKAGNDLALTMDPMVSSLHARIVREGHHFWLEDLGSRNGVYLGDRKLSERVLIGPGTTFTVGQTLLEFMPP